MPQVFRTVTRSLRTRPEDEAGERRQAEVSRRIHEVIAAERESAAARLAANDGHTEAPAPPDMVARIREAQAREEAVRSTRTASARRAGRQAALDEQQESLRELMLSQIKPAGTV